jgi:integrase
MPRPNKIWFRKDVGYWMVTLGGRKVRLAKGRENRQQAQQKFHELMLVSHRRPESPTARVADLVERFLVAAQKRVAPDTYRNYRFYAQKFAEACGQHSVAVIKPFHVTQWVDGQAWNQTTERNARRVALRVMSWAKEEGLILTNPLQGMKCPPANARKRAFSPAETKTILGCAHGPLRILLWGLLQTGARPSELRRLTWDEVRGDRWVIFQHKTAKKIHKPRVVYLTPAMQRLMDYLRKKATSESVFLNSRGQPWTVNAIRLAMGRIKTKCGLADDVCAYLFRHTFGTRAILNGLSSSEVAELLGHTSSAMVDAVYSHLAAEGQHLQQAVCRATRSRATPGAIDRHPVGRTLSQFPEGVPVESSRRASQ